MLRNISDESVGNNGQKIGITNIFAVCNNFLFFPPCASSELTHFRNRIGESGIELIFKESIRMNGKDNDDSDVN